MRRLLVMVAIFSVAGCSQKPERPEAVAVRYAEQHFGKRSFDPDGKGYNINVIGCGDSWCVQLYPALDAATAAPRYAGGGVHLTLRKIDMAVVNVWRTQ